MNSRLAKQVFLFIQQIRDEPIADLLEMLKRNEKLSKSEVLEVQRKQAIKLVKCAYANSPYYRSLFDENGIDINQIESVEDFAQIPFLTKQLFRENLQEITSASLPPKYTTVKTSGSTGTPLKFIKDRLVSGITYACLYRGLSWHGIDMGEPEAMLWGLPLDKTARYKGRVRDFLYNKFKEKEYNLSPEALHDFYVKMLRKKPSFLSGYSSMIYEFANYLKEQKLDGKSLDLKIVKCTSETVYDDYQALIKEVFNCPLVCEYGSSETGIVAFSCKMGNLHIMSDCILVEYINPEDEDLKELRELVITPLYSFSVPFIRYRIGDYCVKSAKECECGLNLPTIGKIIGRTGSFVYSTDGRKYHSTLLNYIFKGSEENIRGIKQYKVYQKSRKLLRIQIARDSSFSEGTIKYLNSKIGATLGPDMRIEYQFVETIEREKSGKLRTFVSEIE